MIDQGIPDYVPQATRIILGHVRATWSPELPHILRVEQEAVPVDELIFAIVVIELTDGRRFTYYSNDGSIVEGGKFSNE